MNKMCFKILAGLSGVLLILVVVVYFIATGPENLEQYPPAETSPYKLPYPPGKTYLCIQSNRAVVSHRGWEQFAYDFAMPLGSDICAARAGEVVTVVSEHDGHGYHWPNNRIVIRHEDGTLASYLHFQKNGNRVTVSDKVERGQVIAASGHVGNSMLPHLHFHVTDTEKKTTLPVTFSNMGRDLGIPRMFKWYKATDTR